MRKNRSLSPKELTDETTAQKFCLRITLTAHYQMLGNFNCRPAGLFREWRVKGSGWWVAGNRWRVNVSTSIVVLFSYCGVNRAFAFKKPLLFISNDQIILVKRCCRYHVNLFCVASQNPISKTGKGFTIYKTVVKNLLVHMAVFVFCLLRWYLRFMLEKYLNYKKLTFEDSFSSLVVCSSF